MNKYEELLRAAIEYRENSESHCGYIGKPIDDAIAAAERELSERNLPVYEDGILAFGFVFNKAYRRYELRISSETRLNITPQLDYLTIYQGPVEAVGFELKSQGQLLDLLSGLGIEVTHG